MLGATRIVVVLNTRRPKWRLKCYRPVRVGVGTLGLCRYRCAILVGVKLCCRLSERKVKTRLLMRLLTRLFVRKILLASVKRWSTCRLSKFLMTVRMK